MEHADFEIHIIQVMCDDRKNGGQTVMSDLNLRKIDQSIKDRKESHLPFIAFNYVASESSSPGGINA